MCLLSQRRSPAGRDRARARSKLLLECPSSNTFAVCSCGVDLRMGGHKHCAHRRPGHAIGPRPSRAALLLPAAPAALLVVWRVSRQQFTGRGGADKLVVGRRHGSGRRRTATGTGLRTSPSILSRRPTAAARASRHVPAQAVAGGHPAGRRQPAHLDSDLDECTCRFNRRRARHRGGCSTAWPSRLCRSPLCRTRPWSQTSGEALGETTRCRGHLSQLENQRGEHWKIGTLAAASASTRRRCVAALQHETGGRRRGREPPERP